MKKLLIPGMIGLAALTLLNGCAIDIGGGSSTRQQTVGQQLIDLQKAKDSGAITDAEFQAQKAKLLAH